MKITKVAQAYLSFLSVVALVGIASGTYIWQTQNSLNVGADSITESQTELLPIINLTTDKDTYIVGEEIEIALVGDFSYDAVTSANINLTYPTDLLEIGEISYEGGMLEKATSEQKDAGTISLAFNPLLAASDSGLIAKVKAKVKAVGTADINIISDDTDAATSLVSTTSQTDIIPVVFGTTLTLK